MRTELLCIEVYMILKQYKNSPTTQLENLISDPTNDLKQKKVLIIICRYFVHKFYLLKVLQV